MNRSIRLGLLSLALCTSAACTSFSGPPPVYGPTGANTKLAGTAANYALAPRLMERFKSAYADPSSTNLTELHEHGYQTIRANCHEWFRHMGSNERRSRLTRSLLTPITNVLTGLLALQDFSANPNRKEDILAGITLGSATITSGLDVYDEQFLFKSENIDSVRTMVMKDLAAQKSKAGGTYGEVVNQLLDLQNTCIPSHIATRVRQKIAT